MQFLKVGIKGNLALQPFSGFRDYQLYFAIYLPPRTARFSYMTARPFDPESRRMPFIAPVALVLVAAMVMAAGCVGWTGGKSKITRYHSCDYNIYYGSCYANPRPGTGKRDKLYHT